MSYTGAACDLYTVAYSREIPARRCRYHCARTRGRKRGRRTEGRGGREEEEEEEGKIDRRMVRTLKRASRKENEAKEKDKKREKEKERERPSRFRTNSLVAERCDFMTAVESARGERYRSPRRCIARTIKSNPVTRRVTPCAFPSFPFLSFARANGRRSGPTDRSMELIALNPEDTFFPQSNGRMDVWI